MAGLEGTVHTPFGPVQKKTGLLIAGGAVLILGYSYYRSRKQAAADAAAQAGANTGIDPATGFAYGSAEDAAALAAQASFITPTGSGGGGGSASGTTIGSGFPTNSAWVQAVIAQLQASGTSADNGATMLAALGRYIAGSPVPPDQQTLIEQAIALEGLPPVAGPAGYPPHINTAAVVTPPTTGGGTVNPPGNHYIDNGTVLKGYGVDRWITDLKAQGLVPPGFSYEANLAPLNPGIAGNILWHANSALNTFKSSATYRLR